MTLMKRYMEDEHFAKMVAQGELIMEATETLCALMEKEGINRTELAKRLGKTKGFVSQLLNGGRNLTLRTLADVLYVMGHKVAFQPRKIDTEVQRCKIYHFPNRWEFDSKEPIGSWKDELPPAVARAR